MDKAKLSISEIMPLRTPGKTPLNYPVEEGFVCPICKNKAGDYDDLRLWWSEYECFLWCYKCERDYPSCLCQPDIDEAIRIFLASVKQMNKNVSRETLE